MAMVTGHGLITPRTQHMCYHPCTFCGPFSTFPPLLTELGSLNSGHKISLPREALPDHPQKGPPSEQMTKLRNHGSALPGALGQGDGCSLSDSSCPLLLTIAELTFTQDNSLPSPRFAPEAPQPSHLLLFLIDLLSARSGKCRPVHLTAVSNPQLSHYPLGSSPPTC